MREVKKTVQIARIEVFKTGEGKSGPYTIHKVVGIDEDGETFNKNFPSWATGYSLVKNGQPGDSIVFTLQQNNPGDYWNPTSAAQANTTTRTSTSKGAADTAARGGRSQVATGEFRSPDQIMRGQAVESASTCASSVSVSAIIARAAALFEYIKDGTIPEEEYYPDDDEIIGDETDEEDIPV